MKNILVTGAAGFIGANLVMCLLRDMTEGTIIGLDNLNSYYDPSLKKHRLQEIEKKCQLSTVNYPRCSVFGVCQQFKRLWWQQKS